MVKQFTSGLIISTFFLAVPGYAASFDCDNAKGYVETSICTNPVLSKLDDTLLSVYAKAQAAAPDQEINIRNEQREWLKNSRNTLTSEDAFDFVVRGPDCSAFESECFDSSIGCI